MQNAVMAAPEAATRASAGMPTFLWIIIGAAVLFFLFVMFRRSRASGGGGRIFFIPARLFFILVIVGVIAVVFLVFKPVSLKRADKAPAVQNLPTLSSSSDYSSSSDSEESVFSSSEESIPESSSEEELFDLGQYIVGRWNNALREGDVIYYSYFSFKADGTFESSGYELIPVSTNRELFPDSTEEWETAPMGAPYSYGTYTVKDGGLELNYPEIDMESYTPAYTAFLSVSVISDNRASMQHTSEFGTGIEAQYIKSDSHDVMSLCEALGVDTTPPVA